MTARNKNSIVPLLWIMLFDHTCLNITFPILTLLFFDTQSSLFSEDVSDNVRKITYGFCVSIPHIVNILITPFLCMLSDTLGRKKILIFGTIGAVLFAVTAGFGVFFGFLWLLFAGRIIQGAFSRTNPIAQAVIGDISTKEKKVLFMGYLQTAISIGAFIGPVIGGYFAKQFYFKQLNFSLPYFIAALFGFVSFILTCLFFKETLTNLNKREKQKYFDFENTKKMLMQPTILRISFILFLIQVSWSLYYQYIPPIIKTILHFDAEKLGLFVGLIAFWLALATTFGIRLLQRWFNLQDMLIFSIYMVLIGTLFSYLLCFLHLENQFQFLIWIAAIPTAMGDVIAFSCITALYSNAVSKTEQGKVMGICFVIVALTWSLTGLLGGFLMSLYSLLPLVIAPISIILVLGLLKKDNFQKTIYAHSV